MGRRSKDEEGIISYRVCLRSSLASGRSSHVNEITTNGVIQARIEKRVSWLERTEEEAINSVW